MNYVDFKRAIVNSEVSDWLYDDDLGKYVYKGDIRISIQSDRGAHDDERFQEEWAEGFSDKKAFVKKFFLQFNGVTIEIFYTAAVDGYRSFIPYPNKETMKITYEQYSIAHIVNGVFLGNDIESYVRRAGITVE